MEIIQVYNYLVLPMVALSLIGFFGFVLGFIKIIAARLHNESYKVPYLSMGAFVVSMCFFIAAQRIVVSTLNRYTLNANVEINISPPIAVKNSDFFKSILSGLFQFKKKSGSYPTEAKWIVSICDSAQCIPIEVARDSRTKDLYWISYKTNGITLPLGYSTYPGELNEL